MDAKVDSNNDVKRVETLIIGFGFSAIPLVRELEKDQMDYVIISDKNSVWDKLKKKNKLDFDLVSSYYTSFYSFDLVKDFKQDYYPLAKEFYDMHLRHYHKHKHKIINDFVDLIENFDKHSIVTTKSGLKYQAKHVVISTGYKRKIVNSLESFDYSISNKTVVFTSIGDSANLMFSKLIPKNNKIISINDGFISLDKIFCFGGITYTLDQSEYHNVWIWFKKLYENTIYGSLDFQCRINETLFISRFKHWINKLVCNIFIPNTLSVKFNTARKLTNDNRSDKTPPNGLIAIKYWPIDTYKTIFSHDLYQSIKKGYILNDIAFFISQGYIELWPKEKTSIDRENNTISCGRKTKKYDYLVDGDHEYPNLPPIKVYHQDYSYVYRDNYFGVVPKKLKNVFFLGLTRPLTGGLANITEIQCLLVHKMIKNKSFRNKIYTNIQDKLSKYNRSSYSNKLPGNTDHVVFYGFYTQEVAKTLGIDVKLRDCNSFKKVMQYFLFPNNAFYFRQSGEYKVDKCNQLVDHIFKIHENFNITLVFLFTYMLYPVLFSEYFFLLIIENKISFLAGIPLIVLTFLAAKMFIIPVQNYTDKFKLAYLSLIACSMPLLGSSIFIPAILLDFVHTFIRRQFGHRYIFNDLKNKRKHLDFYKKYKNQFNRVCQNNDNLHKETN